MSHNRLIFKDQEPSIVLVYGELDGSTIVKNGRVVGAGFSFKLDTEQEKIVIKGGTLPLSYLHQSQEFEINNHLSEYFGLYYLSSYLVENIQNLSEIDLIVSTDSDNLHKQIYGVFKTNNLFQAQLKSQILCNLNKLHSFEIRLFNRKENKECDRLAKMYARNYKEHAK